jgi:hypothetical protein
MKKARYALLCLSWAGVERYKLRLAPGCRWITIAPLEDITYTCVLGAKPPAKTLPEITYLPDMMYARISLLKFLD